MNLQQKVWLIDLDGTMYHGEHMVEEADTFISLLKQLNIPFRFVTNNSSATPEDVASKLNKLGINAEVEHVCTSAQATAQYISQIKPDAQVYVIGENGLRQALSDAQLEIVEEGKPDFVVQGIDRSLTYDKVAKAVQFIRDGASSILTNPDLLLPSTGGLIPGAGSIGAMIEQASGSVPTVVGKPSSILINYALQSLNVSADDAIVLGDNMLTDIKAGHNAKCFSILLLTGITNNTNYSYYKDKANCEPNLIVNDMKQLMALIKQ